MPRFRAYQCGALTIDTGGTAETFSAKSDTGAEGLVPKGGGLVSPSPERLHSKASML